MEVAPEIARVDHAIQTCRFAIEQVEAYRKQYGEAERDVADLASVSSRTASRLSVRLAMHRNDIDGVPQPPRYEPPSRSRRAEAAAGPDRRTAHIPAA